MRAAWANPESTGATTFAHFAFWRNDTTGNSFLTFELNQSSSTWVNAVGTTIPCRTNGDLLLSFESAGGSALATSVYRWTGDGSGPLACPNGANGIVRVFGPDRRRELPGLDERNALFNYLNPATYGSSLPANSFGEAAINLPAVLQGMGQNPCFGFLQMQVHSRSSSSISSALIDYTSPAPVYLQSCSATGYKYQDDNGNGTRDAGEPGLAGFVFYARPRRRRRQGRRRAVRHLGQQRLLPHPQRPGRQRTRSAQVDQAGWNCTGPNPCHYTRTFTTGGNSTGNDFGNSWPSIASGTKFDDLTRTACRMRASPAGPASTFYADYDDDAVKDAGEPSGASDATGAWTIRASQPAPTRSARSRRAGLDMLAAEPVPVPAHRSHRARPPPA